MLALRPLARHVLALLTFLRLRTELCQPLAGRLEARSGDVDDVTNRVRDGSSSLRGRGSGRRFRHSVRSEFFALLEIGLGTVELIANVWICSDTAGFGTAALELASRLRRPPAQEPGRFSGPLQAPPRARPALLRPRGPDENTQPSGDQGRSSGASGRLASRIPPMMILSRRAIARFLARRRASPRRATATRMPNRAGRTCADSEGRGATGERPIAEQWGERLTMRRIRAASGAGC